MSTKAEEKGRAKLISAKVFQTIFKRKPMDHTLERFKI